jgi:hypothetical protein
VNWEQEEQLKPVIRKRQRRQRSLGVEVRENLKNAGWIFSVNDEEHQLKLIKCYPQIPTGSCSCQRA